MQLLQAGPLVIFKGCIPDGKCHLTGEQMRSFEAVFGNKTKHGNTERLCDPNTGEIDTLTITHWKDYDLSLYLRTNWTP